MPIFAPRYGLNAGLARGEVLSSHTGLHGVAVIDRVRALLGGTPILKRSLVAFWQRLTDSNHLCKVVHTTGSDCGCCIRPTGAVPDDAMPRELVSAVIYRVSL